MANLEILRHQDSRTRSKFHHWDYTYLHSTTSSFIKTYTIMKARLHLLTILLLLCLTSPISAQCPSGNISFNSQAELDAFAAEFPNCTEIAGFLHIGGSDITDLSPLQNITRIGDYFTIHNNAVLTNLSDLGGLQSIEGYLSIEHNNQLSSLQGLENLTKIGEYLRISNNNALVNFNGLEGLQSLEGYLSIEHNNQLSSIKGLQNITQIGGNLSIKNNNALINLTGLEGLQSITGFLEIVENVQLSSIQGLQTLTHVDQYLSIINNKALTNLGGLENLQSIPGSVYIDNNEVLATLQGLNNLTHIGENFRINNNAALTNLNALAGLQSIGGYLWVRNNAVLTTLQGLHSLTQIGTAHPGNLSIQNNDLLSTIQAIQNLDPESISHLSISNNPNLSLCDLDNICTYLSDPDNTWTISGNLGTCVNGKAIKNSCDGTSDIGPGTGFITTWKTNNSGSSENYQITIPTNTTEADYNYNIYWSEVGNADNRGSATGITGDHTITFPSEGIYQVEITGDFFWIYFNNEGDKSKIISIDQWGDIPWMSMDHAFAGCNNLTGKALDAPDLSNVFSMAYMFMGATKFNQDLNNWDVGKVETMYELFHGASSFNGNISGWNTAQVTNMYGMFRDAGAFNQDIGNWDVSKCTNMAGMLYGAGSFNQNLGKWDISNVQDMGTMLNNSGLTTANYDATLSGWSTYDIQQDVTLGAEGLTYCNAVLERQSLIDQHGWNIISDMVVGPDCGLVVYINIMNDSTISIHSFGTDSFQQL